MNEDKTGGAAFPGTYTAYNVSRDQHYQEGYSGMTLRDWFAGQALAGIRAQEDVGYETGAREAYRFADAMIKARNKND